MKRTVFAVYKKIGVSVSQEVEGAFLKAVYSHIANYTESCAYGIVFDLPDSTCYKSFGDSEIISAIERCYGALPVKYRDGFFVMVRVRRYNVKKVKGTAFCCDGGALGVISGLLSGDIECVVRFGELPREYDFVYFSGSDEMLEAGGLAALLNSIKGMKSVFPLIKTSESTEYLIAKAKSGCFAFLEGLYSRECKFKQGKIDSLIQKKRSGVGKISEKSCVSNVFAVSIIGEEIKCGEFKLKNGYPRIAYRAAVCASRVFIKTVENDFITVRDCEYAAMVLNSLIAMRMFGFLGEQEMLSGSEILLDKIEEMLSFEKDVRSLGKLVFLLTTSIGAYLLMALSRSDFTVLKFRAQKIVRRVLKKISTKSGYNIDIFLIMCCKTALPNIGEKYALPKLMSVFLSEKEDELFDIGKENVKAPMGAFSVLVKSTNLCFDVNFKSFLLSLPVFRAKSSFLERIEKGSEGARCVEPKNNRTYHFETSDGLFYQSGMKAVSERFFQSGISLSSLPYAAYLEELISGYPAVEIGKVAKICYLTSYNTYLLRELIKASLVVSGAVFCVIFDNKYAFDKMLGELKEQNGIFEKVKLYLCTEESECEKITHDAVFVRRLFSDTTVSELMKETLKRNRLRANVKSQPSVFSNRLLGGGDVKNGFCTFSPSGERISYGEFIKNPFTEIRSVDVTFVPRLRVKLIKVIFVDEKYRNGSDISVLLGDGEVLSSGKERELSKGEKITVLKADTGDGVLFAVQIFKNKKERDFLAELMRKSDFFEYCQARINAENETFMRQIGIIRESLYGEGRKEPIDPRFLFQKFGKRPYSFFSKLVFLSRSGVLSGISLASASKRYAEESHDSGIFKIRLPIGAMGEITMERKNKKAGSSEGDLVEAYVLKNDVARSEETEWLFTKTEALKEEFVREEDQNFVKGGDAEGRRLKNVTEKGEKSGESLSVSEKKSSKSFEKGYRYPFYIYCLDSVKRAEENGEGDPEEMRELKTFYENIESSLRGV